MNNEESTSKEQKKKLGEILIYCGVGAFIIFRIVTWILSIPTVKNLAATIGLSLLIPAAVGMFMYGKSIMDYKSKLGGHLQFMSVIFIVAFVVTTILTYTLE